MTSRPRITTSERRSRLATRHHLAPAARAPDVGTAAHSLIGLHATDPASVYLSAWARVDGVRHAEIDAALYEERTVVKHLAMRRTVWAVATGLMPVVQAAASDAVAAVQRRNVARDVVKVGITDDGERWLADTEAATLAVLARLGPTAGRDLTKQVPALQAKLKYGVGDKAQSLGVVTRVMTVLSASGQVTRAQAGGAWNDRQPRWVLMRDWCPRIDRHVPLAAAEARAELARAWLGTFGPGTYEDVKWWTGWSVAQTRAALRDVGAVEVDLDDGTAGVVLPDDSGAGRPGAPWVALLPSLDPTTMGWKARDWYLGAHRARLFDPHGNAGPTVWSDGQVVGGWGQQPDGRVVVRLLCDIGSEKAAQVETEAARLTAWLDGALVRPSFPTPLQRELSG